MDCAGTADGLFAGGGALGAGATLDLVVVGRGGVPGKDVGAVVLNVTVTEPTAAGFVTVFPTGTVRPTASNLNFVAGQTTPNLVIAKVGAGGMVSLFNFVGRTQLIADVVGWFPAVSLFTSLQPARLLDTRAGLPTIDGLFNGGGAVAGGALLDVTVAGRGGVPATGVGSVVVNITATEPTTSGYVTVFPTGTVRPTASNLNFVAGQTTPNLVIAKVGAGGMVSLFNFAGSTQLIADVVGWFPATSSFVGLQPARLLDTRAALSTIDGLFDAVGAVAGGAVLDVTVVGRGGVPTAGVGSVVLNITATEPTAASFVTVFPTGRTRPTASNLNLVAGQTTPNLVIAKVGAGGKVSLFNLGGNVHLVADVVGWFPAGPNQLTSGTATAVAAGYAHWCALLPDATIKCWGDNFDGVLGNGTTIDSPSPVFVVGIDNATAISLGETGDPFSDHSCAVLADATVKCWGDNFDGQVYNFPFRRPYTPTPITVSGITNATAVAAGGDDTCARLADGTIKCWGDNGVGQLGSGTTTGSPTPVTVTGVITATAIAAGLVHSCARLTDGTIKCWGYNLYGQLGNGTTTNSSTPVTVTGITNATTVAAGDRETCARLADGTIKCWGSNQYGQLGNGTTSDSSTPVTVTGITNAIAVTTGFVSSCALLTDGTIDCWGWGTGVDGSGTTTPIPIEGL